MSAFDLQRIVILFVLDFLLFDSLTTTFLGTPVKITIVENFALVLDLAMLHLHMRNSHDYLPLVCNELES